MAGWLVWVILACAFGAGERYAGGFFLAPFALGALAAAAGDAVGGTAVGLIVFAVVSILMLVLVRPRVRSHTPLELRAGAAALIGRQAVVLERIANAEGVGLVRIDREVWTARSLYDDQEIEAGAWVEVVDARGATALVTEEETDRAPDPRANSGRHA